MSVNTPIKKARQPAIKLRSLAMRYMRKTGMRSISSHSIPTRWFMFLLKITESPHVNQIKEYENKSSPFHGFKEALILTPIP